MVHFPHYINAFMWEKQADTISALHGKLENRNQYGLEGSSERSLDDGYNNNLQEIKFVSFVIVVEYQGGRNFFWAREGQNSTFSNTSNFKISQKMRKEVKKAMLISIGCSKFLSRGRKEILNNFNEIHTFLVNNKHIIKFVKREIIQCYHSTTKW